MVLLGRAFTADRTHGKFLIKFQADDIGTLKTSLRVQCTYFSALRTRRFMLALILAEGAEKLDFKSCPSPS